MVKISESSYNAIIKHAEAGFPHEVCGVLIGRDHTVADYKKCNNLNTERAHDRYELDPLSFKEADDYSREIGKEIIGIYHSHPDHPSMASETDRQRAWPEWIYIIFSINEGKYNDARAWILEDSGEKFYEEPIEVTPD